MSERHIEADSARCPVCNTPAKICSECAKRFYASSVNAVTCSGACRVARSRRMKKKTYTLNGRKSR